MKGEDVRAGMAFFDMNINGNVFCGSDRCKYEGLITIRNGIYVVR